MRRRGENVSSIEMETSILDHSGVAAVATYAVPSTMSEDDIMAAIVPADGAELTPEGLFDFFKKQIPYYAIPVMSSRSTKSRSASSAGCTSTSCVKRVSASRPGTSKHSDWWSSERSAAPEGLPARSYETLAI
jgi:hypothetical protein